MNYEPRTALPLASSSGCCCSPTAGAPKPPAAVVPFPEPATGKTPDDGASSPAAARPSHQPG